MRPILYVTFLTFMLNLFSCQKQESIHPPLLQIEELMEEHPDSSWLLLQAVEFPERLPQKEHAIWCLLWTQAMDKNYMEHTSDSLITIAVNYFDKKSESERKAKALFYKGRINYDLGGFEQALPCFLMAADIARTTKEYKLCGLIYDSMGQLYGKQNLDAEVSSCLRIAYTYYTQAQDSLGQVYILRDIGRYYALTEPYHLDSAICYYKEALSLATRMDHTVSQSSVLNDLGNVYKRQGDYSVAKILIQQSINSTSQQSNSLYPKYSNLGDLYLKIEVYDSARYYLEKSLQTDNLTTKGGGYYRLAELEEAIGDFKQACLYKDSFMLYKDSIDYQVHSADLAAIKQKHHIEVVISEIHEKNLIQKIILLSVGGSIIIGLLLIIVFYQKLKRTKELEFYQKERDIQQYRQLIDQYKELQDAERSKIDSLNKRNKELEYANQQTVVDLNSQLVQTQDMEFSLALKDKNLQLQQSEIDLLNRKNEKLILGTQNLSHEYKQNKQLLHVSQQTIADLESQLAQVQNMESSLSLRDRNAQLQLYILNQSPIFRQISAYIGKSRCNKMDEHLSFQTTDWDDFLLAMDKGYSDFSSRLKVEFNLKQEDLIVASLIKLDIKPCNMQKVLNINSPSLISRKKTTLAECLHTTISYLESFVSKY